jgi:RNA polymerase sigma-70 factor (ECF subfamily)
MDSSDSTFEQLLKAYEGKVLRLCFAMLGNRALAEETAQEVFLRIWRALGAFRGEASLSTWVYAITRNACLTAVERMKTAATESLADPRYFEESADEGIGTGPAGTPNRCAGLAGRASRIAATSADVILSGREIL